MASKASASGYRDLSRRERQIMDVLHEDPPMSAKDIQAKLPEPPSYSAVRALIARLVDKGVIRFEQQGAKYIYHPVQKQEVVQDSAVSRLLKTFFKGSRAKAVVALLDADGDDLSDGEIADIERKIARLKKNK